MKENLQLSITYRQILEIAVPISFALLVPQFNFIINSIFLGNLSEQALATASITGVYYLIFTGIGYGLNNGMQALISRRAGENKPEEIGRIFNQGTYMATIIAAFSIVFTYLVAPPILRYSVHSPVIQQQAISFLRIRIWGLPFLYIYQLRNALLIGINQSKYLVIGTLGEAVCNVFFDYTLIFGKLGFPRLGFNGAAVASIVAEFAGMFVIFVVIHYAGISKWFSLFREARWNAGYAKLITITSGPLTFQHGISVVSWLFFYLLIEHHGATSLAVSNTMRNIFGFFGIVTWSFAATTNTMVSNIVGQKKIHLVQPLIKKIMWLSVSIAATTCLILNFFPAAYLSLYAQDENFMQLGLTVIRVVAFAMIPMAASVVWLYAVTGSGNSKITFYIELLAIVLYCFYVYFILEVYQLSIIWGWMSEWLYWSAIFFLSYLYVQSGRWKATLS